MEKPPLDRDHGEEYGTSEMGFWEELPCGVYSMRVGASKLDANIIAIPVYLYWAVAHPIWEYHFQGVTNMVGEVKRHEWTDPILNELIKWDRTSVQPKPKELNVSRMKFPNWQHDMLSVHSTKVPYESGSLTAVLVLIVMGLIQASVLVPSEAVLLALREAVMRRTAISTMFKAAKCGKIQGHTPVAVLFSGGLDSMILSALLDECLDSKCKYCYAKNRGEYLDAVETEQLPPSSVSCPRTKLVAQAIPQCTLRVPANALGMISIQKKQIS
ncbi:hypothetical protein HYC85_020987 [Camellia sinensis]|uniref:Asparagine synthetase domain-containing protein n=1 Tax=Camellia sinensis TaxID=4442 RepID=A0A7J7GGD3_CAMSI|nr:hypothetical protein HYC85_020987 [Camellia sinensis]